MVLGQHLVCTSLTILEVQIYQGQVTKDMQTAVALAMQSLSHSLTFSFTVSSLDLPVPMLPRHKNKRSADQKCRTHTKVRHRRTKGNRTAARAVCFVERLFKL